MDFIENELFVEILNEKDLIEFTKKLNTFYIELSDIDKHTFVIWIKKNLLLILKNKHTIDTLRINDRNSRFSTKIKQQYIINIALLNSKIQFLQEWSNEQSNSKPKLDNINSKHEHIFSNNGFILFEYILNKFVSQNRGRKTDIAFYYWSMYNDKKKYIHQRPEPFKQWFFDTYNNEDLGQLKTYDNAKNKNRLINYSTALDWFNTK